MKDKFRALTRGEMSGGGKRQGEEKKAKEIQGEINTKHGVVVNNFSGEVEEDYLREESERGGMIVEGKSLSSGSESERVSHKKEVPTRRVLQGELLQAINRSSSRMQAQHEDKMLVFCKFLEIMKQKEEREMERDRKRRRRSSDSD